MRQVVVWQHEHHRLVFWATQGDALRDTEHGRLWPRALREAVRLERFLLHAMRSGRARSIGVAAALGRLHGKRGAPGVPYASCLTSERGGYLQACALNLELAVAGSRQGGGGLQERLAKTACVGAYTILIRALVQLPEEAEPHLIWKQRKRLRIRSWGRLASQMHWDLLLGAVCLLIERMPLLQVFPESIARLAYILYNRINPEPTLVEAAIRACQQETRTTWRDPFGVIGVQAVVATLPENLTSPRIAEAPHAPEP
jgi:hypothetical protein